MKIKDLSFTGQDILFSWATKETLPRFGILDLTNETFSLSDKNISGGIYTPVEYNGQIYYTGKFYKESRLLELKEPFQNMTVFDNYENYETEENQAGDNINASVVAMLGTPISYDTSIVTQIPSQPFSPFPYLCKGLFFPIGGINTNTPALGFTYLTSLPWYSSITLISAGYDIKTNTAVFELDYQSGTDTNLFNYAFGTITEVDNLGLKKVSATANVSSGIDFGKMSMAAISFRTDFSYDFALEGDERLDTVQVGILSYSSMHSTGPGTYENAGVSFSGGLAHSYRNGSGQYDVEFDAECRIPKLIPIWCTDNFTYNLPLKVSTRLFSLSGPVYELANVNAETIIFGHDIQKAVPFLSALFLNDVILTFGYEGGIQNEGSESFKTSWRFLYTKEYLEQLKSGRLVYKDYAFIKLSLGFTPNIGAFANPSARFNYFVSCAFGKKENLPENIFSWGLEAKF